MSGFKKLVERDNAYLMNLRGYGETRHIRYDGTTYENVNCVLTGTKLNDYSERYANRADGIFTQNTKLHVLISNIGGVQPDKGTYIEVSDPVDDGSPFENVYFERYRIAKSILNIGLLRLELEAYTE